MNLRQIAIVFSVVVLMLCAGCGKSADDQAHPSGPVALTTPSQWQAGDVLTREASDTHTETVKKILPGGVKSTIRNTDQVTTATWMEKTLERDNDGARTRYLVYVKDWSRRAGDVTDDSLKGVYVNVTDSDAGRQWSLVHDDKEPSDDARKWLDRRFGPPLHGEQASDQLGADDEQVRKLILTDKPVRPGESWTPDLTPLIDALATGGVTIDRARMTATTTLVGVSEGKAHCTLEASLPISSGPAGITWTKSGVITLRIEAYVPSTGRIFVPSSVDSHGTMEGQTEVQGVAVELGSNSREIHHTTIGGDFPAPQ